jgi:hypothetical protein
MILSFSTQLNGKPTYFVEKILAGFIINAELSRNMLFMAHIAKFVKEYALYKKVPYQEVISDIEKVKPKLHTIREDLKDRWVIDRVIDFFINCRQPTMFRFAPRIPVDNTQEVFMTYAHSNLIQISIDGRELFSYTERLEFAINDGFDSWEDFFNYFYPKIKASPKECYKPKLIHWTDLRY